MLIKSSVVCYRSNPILCYRSNAPQLSKLSKQCSGCVQVWIGYNQSLRPCQSGLTLNVDITAAAFLEGQPMLQLIGSTVGMQNVSGGLNPGQVRSINKAIRGVQVQP